MWNSADAMQLDDVLNLPLRARVLRHGSAAILALGDADDAWAARVEGWPMTPWLDARALFGLPIHSAPHPILIRSVTAERGLVIDTLAVFSWIEDNAIREPRAEVFGVSPFGDEPTLFLRDFDLDRPPQACVRLPADLAGGLLLAGGALLVDPLHTGPPAILAQDDAALAGLESQLPADARAFSELLRAECATGRGLRAVLKRLRQRVAPELMALADGWRVLCAAIPCARINPHSTSMPEFPLPQLEPPPAPRKPAPRQPGRR